MFTKKLSSFKFFLTELTGVRESFDVLLYVFLDMTIEPTAVVTNSTVMSPLSLLHQLLDLTLNLGHVKNTSRCR